MLLIDKHTHIRTPEFRILACMIPVFNMISDLVNACKMYSQYFYRTLCKLLWKDFTMFLCISICICVMVCVCACVFGCISSRKGTRIFQHTNSNIYEYKHTKIINAPNERQSASNENCPMHSISSAANIF